MARLSRHLRDYYIGDSETGSPSPPFNYYYHHYYIGDSETGSPSPPFNYYYHHYYIGDSEIGSPSPPLLGKMSRGKMSSVCPPRHQVAIDHIMSPVNVWGWRDRLVISNVELARPSRGLQT